MCATFDLFYTHTRERVIKSSNYKPTILNETIWEKIAPIDKGVLHIIACRESLLIYGALYMGPRFFNIRECSNSGFKDLYCVVFFFG